MNLKDNGFKSIVAILLMKIIDCLQAPFLSVTLAVIFSAITVSFLFPSLIIFDYFILISKEMYGLVGISFLFLTIVFTTISVWKISHLSQQRALKKSLFSSISGSREPQFVTDKHKNIIFDNKLSRLCFNKLGTHQEIKPKSLRELESLIDKDSKIVFTRILKNSIANCEDAGELIFKLDGTVNVSWNLTTEPVNSLNNLMIWRIEDTTEQRAREVERLIEENYVGDLLNQLPVGFFSADSNGNLKYLNSVLREWLGIHEGIDVGELPSFMEFIAPEPIEGETATTDASGMHGGLKLQSTDGSSFSAYLIQSQKESGSGNFEYSRSIVLREPFTPLVDDGLSGVLLRRLPWLFSDAPVGIVMLDIKGEVTECNRAFLKLLGLHRDGIIGRPLSERISKEDASDADVQLSKVVMGIMPATLLDVRMPAGGERELTASLYVSRITDKNGEVVGLVMHVIDTTEKKNLEIQFNQAQKMQAVGQLAGGVAHDFNNLLTAMGGFCDLLLDRHGSDDPSFSDIMQIKQNTNRAANLVRQLLAFSRRQTLQPKVFAITDAINDLSNLLRRLIGENITLDINHGKDIDLIRTDPGQFDQVVINLAVNARDAMPGGGVIDISTERVAVKTSIQRGHEVMPAGEYILIKVVDTGSGITKEDIGRIFEPFFSTKVVGEGTGLGLSTVYGIVRQSDGYIFVDSAPGNGTTFSLYFPAFSAAEADYVSGGDAEEEKAVDAAAVWKIMALPSSRQTCAEIN